MRIKEFSIRRYGPLPDIGRTTLGDFSLFFGKNEDGKTLCVDAILKMMLKKGRQNFEKIDRVDEEPEGYVIIQCDDGKDIKLPEKGDLTRLTGVTPEECRNIFVIRNSDLSIAKESGFYGNVTDRLTGLRTEEISSIKNQLKELGRLTKAESTATLRDIVGEKIKTRMTAAEKLIQTIELLQTTIDKENLDRSEEELLNARERVDLISKQLEHMEEARKREKYQVCEEAYQALVAAKRKVKQLAVFSSSDERLWDQYEADIKDSETELERLAGIASDKREERRLASNKFEEGNIAFQVVTAKKKKLDDEIKTDIRNYEMKSGELANKLTKKGFYSLAAIISATLLAISVFGIVLKPSPLLYLVFALFLALTGVFAGLFFAIVREQAWLAGIFQRIKLSLSRFGLRAESIEETLLRIQSFDDEYSKHQSELEAVRTEVALLDREITKLEKEDIPNAEKRKTGAMDKIHELMNKSGVTDLQDYRQKLGDRSTCQNIVDAQLGVLRSHFGEKGKTFDDNLANWIDEINALKAFKDSAQDLIYNEKAVSQLKAEQEACLSELHKLEIKMTSFYEQLREIEKGANEILRPNDDYIHCNTSVDIKAIKGKLASFVADIDNTRGNALETIKVFEILEKEEEGKIAVLFGENSLVSKYFKEITGGLYEEVQFVLNDVKQVQVKLGDGRMLGAEKLSGGAYDQLYISIRLALGQELLKQRRGFFLFDDPFIKADPERLRTQIDVMKRISDNGWQIIYFTAKGEIKDVLKQDIESGKVRYLEVRS
jgi:uncharacterized protein YhaN